MDTRSRELQQGGTNAHPTYLWVIWRAHMHVCKCVLKNRLMPLMLVSVNLGFPCFYSLYAKTTTDFTMFVLIMHFVQVPRVVL